MKKPKYTRKLGYSVTKTDDVALLKEILPIYIRSKIRSKEQIKHNLLLKRLYNRSIKACRKELKILTKYHNKRQSSDLNNIDYLKFASNIVSQEFLDHVKNSKEAIDFIVEQLKKIQVTPFKDCIEWIVYKDSSESLVPNPVDTNKSTDFKFHVYFRWNFTSFRTKNRLKAYRHTCMPYVLKHILYGKTFSVRVEQGEKGSFKRMDDVSISSLVPLKHFPGQTGPIFTDKTSW